MKDYQARRKEARDIMLMVSAGDATTEQVARLSELIIADPKIRNYAVQIFDQQAALAWHGLTDGDAATFNTENCACRSPVSRWASEINSPEIRCTNAHEGLPQDCTARVPTGLAPTNRAVAPVDTNGALATPNAAVGGRGALAVVAAFFVGALVTAALLLSYRSVPTAAVPESLARRTAQPIPSSADRPYRARLVGSTACSWDTRWSALPEIGSTFGSGDSLKLLQGLAEVDLEWLGGGSASVQFEGPAAMSLSAQGMPSLRFGKLSADVNSHNGMFVLETPLGCVVVPEYASLGVAAFGSDMEVHVFDGKAWLESAWLSQSDREETRLAVDAGRSVWMRVSPNGTVKTNSQAAEEDYFATQLSMASDMLSISKPYVDQVLNDDPLAYWRFEDEQGKQFRNEVADRFHCRIVGSLGRVGNRHSRAIDFGVTDQAGELICESDFGNEIGDSYSIEAWIKPSHYHLGAVISLVGASTTDTRPHGLLIELGGTTSNEPIAPRHPAMNHPGRIRFLHRNPASYDLRIGTSCYSDVSYALRKWQHVVAVKDEIKMRLYIDGRLTNEQRNTTSLPDDLKLLVGRLYPLRNVRPFIGQLDELAIYGRAISHEEIKRHYGLARPNFANKENDSI